jgi:hypothetical protein
MKTAMRVFAVTAVTVLSPGTARADWFFFPFATVNTGGATTRESGAYGGSVGWGRGWLSAEGEVTVAPDFFDDDDGFRTRRRSTGLTGTALAGPRLGAWRPYGAVGFGLLRFEIAEVGGLASVSDDRPAVHAGGGLMWIGQKRFGLRGDVRYIRAVDEEEIASNVFPEQFADFDYWRVGGGVVIRW